MTIFAKTISLLTLGISLLSVSGLMSTNVQASGYGGRYAVNATKGVNLRDENCNRVGFASYGTSLGKFVTPLENTGLPINCKVNGRNYKMVAVQKKIWKILIYSPFATC